MRFTGFRYCSKSFEDEEEAVGGKLGSRTDGERQEQWWTKEVGGRWS